VELLGHVRERTRLWRAADEGRLHHCLLFEGPEGVGKAQVALELALYVNCEGPRRPCRECRSCRMILAGTHPDHLLVGPDPERATPVISAAQARQVVSALSLQRHSARRRFVVLDPADALTEEAGNALLKTLEEPPPHTGFVLLTHRPAALLQTVRSRSQRVSFGPVRDAELLPWARARGIDPALVPGAFGSPGRLLARSEGEAEASAEVAAALVACLGQPLHLLFAFTEAQSRHADGAPARSRFVLEILRELLRDVVQLAAGHPERVIHAAQRPALDRWARALWPDGVGRLERVLAAAADRGEINVNARTVLDAVLTAVNQELSQVST